MATLTPNYHLSKPEPTDPFGYNSFLPLFNDNMDKIDQIGGGGGSANIVNCTQAEYDALPSSKESNNVLYVVYFDGGQTLDPDYSYHKYGDNDEIIVRVYHEGQLDQQTLWFFRGWNQSSTVMAIPSSLTAYAPSDGSTSNSHQSRNYTDSTGTTQNGWIGFYSNSIRAWSENFTQNLTGIMYGVVDPKGAGYPNPQTNPYVDDPYVYIQDADATRRIYMNGREYAEFNGGGGGSSWTDIEGVLTAGSTTLTLNSTSINTTSVLNIYVDTFGVCPIDVEVSNGSVTLTFNEMENDLSVLVRITENGAEPSPYTLMNYLEVTSAGAYIDTGVANSATAYFEIDFQYTGTPTNNDGVFGAMGSGNEFVVNSYGGVSYANTGGSRAVFTATNLDRHVIKADNSGILIDEVSSGASVDWSRATGYNYFLFAFNYLNNQKYYTGHAKIYSVKIWDGDTLVREFIPAIRNEDDEIGMYDRVNDVFYTNNGTGTFTIG